MLIQTGGLSLAGFSRVPSNKLTDENYEVVQSQGYGELVIPANYFDKNTIYLPKAHCEVMDIMAAAGYKTYVNGGAVRDGILSHACSRRRLPDRCHTRADGGAVRWHRLTILTVT